MLAAGLYCLQAIAAIPAGAVPVRADFAEAPCPAAAAAVTAALRYDPAIGAARAVRDIAAGETLAAFPAATLPDIRPGEALFLVARVGTATVEREVVAAQPGRRGQHIFVRAPGGRLIRARISESAR